MKKTIHLIKIQRDFIVKEKEKGIEKKFIFKEFLPAYKLAIKKALNK